MKCDSIPEDDVDDGVILADVDVFWWHEFGCTLNSIPLISCLNMSLTDLDVSVV